jgi:hypothetical protein
MIAKEVPMMTTTRVSPTGTRVIDARVERGSGQAWRGLADEAIRDRFLTLSHPLAAAADGPLLAGLCPAGMALGDVALGDVAFRSAAFAGASSAESIMTWPLSTDVGVAASASAGGRAAACMRATGAAGARAATAAMAAAEARTAEAQAIATARAYATAPATADVRANKPVHPVPGSHRTVFQAT